MTVDNNRSDLATFITERLEAIGHRKSKAAVAAEAGYRSQNMLTMFATGEAKLQLDHVEGLARALECEPEALMRLALRQWMDERVVRLVLAAGASESQNKIDQLGTWLIALSTNIRIALEGMDRTSAAVQTLAELIANDFNRVEQLSTEIEKRGTALIGYGHPEAPSAPPNA